MYTSLKPIQVREELLNRHMRIFTAPEFQHVFQSNHHATKYFLEEQTRQGLLLRLKQGVYTLKTDVPSEEEIANALYRPSYISFGYALASYGIMPERPYTVTSATTKSTALFTVAEKSFAYYAIKQEAYTGYHLVQNAPKSYLIAEPEKALVDYLYFVTLGKRGFNDRLYTKNLNREKIRNYAKLYQRDSLEELITKTYANN